MLRRRRGRVRDGMRGLKGESSERRSDGCLSLCPISLTNQMDVTYRRLLSVEPGASSQWGVSNASILGWGDWLGDVRNISLTGRISPRGDMTARGIDALSGSNFGQTIETHIWAGVGVQAGDGASGFRPAIELRGPGRRPIFSVQTGEVSDCLRKYRSSAHGRCFVWQENKSWRSNYIE